MAIETTNNAKPMKRRTQVLMFPFRYAVGKLLPIREQFCFYVCSAVCMPLVRVEMYEILYGIHT